MAGQAGGAVTTVAGGGGRAHHDDGLRTGAHRRHRDRRQRQPGAWLGGPDDHHAESAGYTTADPTDADKDLVNVPISKTIVYYSVGVDMNLVNTLARDLGGATVQPMPTEIPVSGSSLGAATVLVMLGTDMADKPLTPVLAAAPNAVGTQTTTTTTTA